MVDLVHDPLSAHLATDVPPRVQAQAEKRDEREQEEYPSDQLVAGHQNRHHPEEEETKGQYNAEKLGGSGVVYHFPTLGSIGSTVKTTLPAYRTSPVL